MQKDIDTFLNNLEQKIINKEKHIAREAFIDLVEYSPVLTGAYVLSHNISINETLASQSIGSIGKVYKELRKIESPILKQLIITMRTHGKKSKKIQDILTSSEMKKEYFETQAKLGKLVRTIKSITKKARKKAKIQALQKLSKVNQIKKITDVIHISNWIDYADKVEYIGWARTPAYHPYGKTKTNLRTKMLLILKSTSLL